MQGLITIKSIGDKDMKKTIVSTNRLMILAMHAHRCSWPTRVETTVAAVQATSEDADKARFASIYAFKKGHGEFSEMGVPFLHVRKLVKCFINDIYKLEFIASPLIIVILQCLKTNLR